METILNYSNNNNYNNNNSNNNNHHHSPINNIIQTEHLEFNYLQDLCNRGQLAFSHANYHNAIAIYDRVIDQIQGKIIGKMFFFRCITNYQLGDYQQALKDAQRAILADPTLADAYLVGGNILFVVQQLWADAVTLYQYGMDHVPINDPKYQHLVQCKNQVTQEIRQRNTRMLHILPYDIICEIMAKLSIADRLNCAACCKDWHDYLLDSPVMWQDIHLDDPPSLLDKIGVIASQHVRRLTLTGSRRNQDVLNRLVEFNWCHLESISKPSRILVSIDPHGVVCFISTIILNLLNWQIHKPVLKIPAKQKV
ncbi:hypothetical protein BDA99DRAFT_292589 [Phascolomyces articulosus]|uniref:F-box domain-containing protein n=1 Tax=Phascolomyces articulosus TaxID=60185 RepID=A0AAD5P7T5_9FUNG|nr:hypothetical protein BDA99DRAFT_292589 [Phascolomyces articulosus]